MNTEKTKKILLLILLITAVSLPFMTAAVTCPSGFEKAGATCLPPQGDAPGATDPAQAINKVIQFALFIVGLVAVVFVVIGGYRYIMAGGNEENVKAAKSTIKNALIGLIIVLFAWAIVNVVASFISRGGGGAGGPDRSCGSGSRWDEARQQCVLDNI